MSIAINHSIELGPKVQESNEQVQLVASHETHSVEHEEGNKAQDDYMFWTDQVKKTANIDRKATLESLRNRELCLLRMISTNSDENLPEEIQRILSDNISNLDMRLERMADQPEHAFAS